MGSLANGTMDGFGFTSVEDRVRVHDLHAMMLHLIGNDHTQSTYRCNGRNHRIADVYGNVVSGLVPCSEKHLLTSVPVPLLSFRRRAPTRNEERRDGKASSVLTAGGGEIQQRMTTPVKRQ